MKYTLLLISLFILASCSDKREKDGNQQTIDVMGSSVIKASPDISLISLDISSESDNKATAISEINRSVASILDQIKTKNIKTNEININNLNIDWNYRYSKDKKRTVYYSATQYIQIKTGFDLDEIEKIVEIVKDISRLNFSIGFDLSTHKRDSIDNVLTRLALKDATRKSDNIAAASHLEIRKILGISYHVDRPGPMAKYAPRMMMEANADSRVNLSPQEIELSDNIQVTYLVRSNK